MLLVNIPTNLVGDNAQVVAIYPVLHSIMFVIVLILLLQQNIPERLEVMRLGLGDEVALAVVAVLCATKLCHMFQSSSNINHPVRIRAEVEMLLVVVNIGCVGGVDVTMFVELVFFIAGVHIFAKATLQTNLQPPLGVRHGPEAVSANPHLWNGFGVGALSKRAC